MLDPMTIITKQFNFTQALFTKFLIGLMMKL
jgi:hypothetical protein